MFLLFFSIKMLIFLNNWRRKKFMSVPKNTKSQRSFFKSNDKTTMNIKDSQTEIKVSLVDYTLNKLVNCFFRFLVFYFSLKK